MTSERKKRKELQKKQNIRTEERLEEGKEYVGIERRVYVVSGSEKWNITTNKMHVNSYSVPPFSSFTD